MKDEWVVIEIAATGVDIDIVSAVLSEFGCSGTVVETVALDTFSVPADELDPNRTYTLEAYFDCGNDSAGLQENLRTTFAAMHPVGRRPEIVAARRVRTEDWAENWKQNFAGFRVGDKLIVKPSWEPDCRPTADEVVIEIDPGMAFGTGTHGTTRLCLEVIADLLAAEQSPASMLDVGTGSGILALGAAALGCRSIVANDIDPLACQVARENIAKNGYGEQIQVTELPLERLDGCYDLVVANILAEENVRLKHELCRHLNPGGRLVLSGILQEKENFVRDGFADQPLTFAATRSLDGWVCLSAERR